MKNNTSSPHVSVMLQECLDFFSDREIKVFFEGTVGAGGHAKAILEAHPEIEMYIGCDQDPEALCLAQERLKPWQDRVHLEHANFGSLDAMIQAKGLQQVDGFFLTWGCLLCS